MAYNILNDVDFQLWCKAQREQKMVGLTTACQLLKHEFKWVAEEIQAITHERNGAVRIYLRKLKSLLIPIGATMRVMYVDMMPNNRVGIRVKLDYSGDLSNKLEKMFAKDVVMLEVAKLFD